MADTRARRGAYLDSSALVKLVVPEPESSALHRYLRGRRLLSSALVRTEVVRAVAAGGEPAALQAAKVLRWVDQTRVSDRILDAAGVLPPSELRSLDAVHLATAQLLGEAVSVVVTYDHRMAEAARALGFRVHAPGADGQ